MPVADGDAQPPVGAATRQNSFTDHLRCARLSRCSLTSGTATKTAPEVSSDRQGKGRKMRRRVWPECTHTGPVAPSINGGGCLQEHFPHGPLRAKYLTGANGCASSETPQILQSFSSAVRKAISWMLSWRMTDNRSLRAPGRCWKECILHCEHGREAGQKIIRRIIARRSRAGFDTWRVKTGGMDAFSIAGGAGADRAKSPAQKNTQLSVRVTC